MRRFLAHFIEGCHLLTLGYFRRHAKRGYSATILADSPVVYYPLDEVSGTVAYDHSGHGYHATIETEEQA